MTAQPLRGLILDVDGTLVDSNDAHARAWQDALGEHGHDTALPRIRRLIGMGGDKLLPELTGIVHDSPLGKAISKSRAEIFRERYLPHVAPFPQVRSLLLRLREQGLRLSVGTSAKREELAPLLEIARPQTSSTP